MAVEEQDDETGDTPADKEYVARARRTAALLIAEQAAQPVDTREVRADEIDRRNIALVRQVAAAWDNFERQPLVIAMIIVAHHRIGDEFEFLGISDPGQPTIELRKWRWPADFEGRQRVRRLDNDELVRTVVWDVFPADGEMQAPQQTKEK